MRPTVQFRLASGLNNAWSVRPATYRLAAGFLALTTVTSPAYLGSFTPADGYNIAVFSGAVNWSDVSYYNAGGYGPNAGGGPGPTLISPDSGLWEVAGPVGGYFTTAAARASVVGSSPPYPGTLPPGTLPAYIVGDHSPGRTDFSSLAVRNDTPSGTGAIVYDYALDSFDTGGVPPSSIISGSLATQFYFCPNPVDPVPKVDKFAMSFRDSLGNTGLQWGYARDNEVTWRTTSSGPWNYTGIYADAANWDGVLLDVDLTTDTFLLDYYDISAATWYNLAPAGTPLGSPLLDLTVLRWQLEDGIASGVGGKNFFDDFSFTQTAGAVPEPSTWLLGGVMAGLAGWRLRRTRV